jgi:hypothetical protein
MIKFGTKLKKNKKEIAEGFAKLYTGSAKKVSSRLNEQLTGS